jgi:hypothetical protein
MIFHARTAAALVLCLTSAGLAVLSFAAKPAVDSLDGKRAGKAPGLVQTESGWSVIGSPNPGSGQNGFSGVTCATAVDCWAVGSYGNIGGTNPGTLIEKWDGNSWSVVSSPNTSPTQSNGLDDVTCVSASDCWAVGIYHDGSFGHTLIERWDGATWSIVASPNTSATQTNVLESVACTSTNACWAVGYYYNGSFDQTLIEKWDGVSWSIVSSPNNGTTRSNDLSDVTCASANNCWAVGSYSAGSFYQTLILSWDGVAWISRSAPNLAYSSEFSGVTCVSDNDCWAVGGGQPSAVVASRTLIARWQGGLWEIVSSPNVATSTHPNALVDVTCTAADNCWAVGFASIHPPNHTMIQRWNGAEWSLVSSPNVGNFNNILQGVACAAAYECWTAGYHANQDPTTGTLIEGHFGLEIISVARLANNHKLVNCIGIPNQVNNLQSSPDLNPPNFATVSPPPPAADANGAFQYDDANAGSTRFYRLAFP